MADGVYDGALPPDVPAGRCKLTIRLGTFDTADDTDDKPEQRIPTGATLTLTPNVTGPVILPDGTIMVVKGTTLSSDTGSFDFWAIDGMRSSVNPAGWNWTAVLKIDAATQVRFTFSPDSTSPTPINLGTLIPVSDPQTGVATVVGRGVASISVDPDTRHVLFVMSDDTTYDAGAIPPGPKGDKGDQGAKGDKGDAGPANVLSIGTVTTGATGTPAAASITGTAPSQTLNLTLPAGPKGDAGSGGGGGGTNTHTGTGFPAAGLGVVGDTYIDTAATCGALVWRKWPDGWRVEHGDTGWRNTTPAQGGSLITVGGLRVRRVDNLVTWELWGDPWGGMCVNGAGMIQWAPAAVSGFTVAGQDITNVYANGDLSSPHKLSQSASEGVILRPTRAAEWIMGRSTCIAWTAWPTTLPGTPA